MVEIAAALRTGGTSIDVRGEAVKISERMRLLDKIKGKKITTSVEFVDARDKPTATLKNFGEDASGQDIELYRDHLLGILYESGGQDIEYLFGTDIL